MVGEEFARNGLIGGNNMNKREIIELILSNGNPTQKYIVCRDVLGMDIYSPDMLNLQEQIIQSKQAKKLLKKQNADGWFGKELHGGEGFDGIINQIKELGIEAYHPFMQKAKQALLLDLNPSPWFAAGKSETEPVEAYTYSRAMVLACLYNNDEHDKLLLRFQDELIEKFAAVKNIESLNEVSKELTTKRFTETKGWKWHPDLEARIYLKDKVDTFPWVADIYVLAASLNWKNSQTENIITEAMIHISSFAPVPIIYHPGYVRPVGTYEFLDNPFDCPHTQFLTDGRLNDYYCLCKICDIEQIAHYYKNVEWLTGHIKNNSLIDNLSNEALRAIEQSYAYSGKWESEIQKKTDIYYRVLLILHYAKVNF